MADAGQVDSIFMTKNQKLAILLTLFTLIGCIKKDHKVTSSIQPIIPMNIGEVREFMTNGLNVIFKKTINNTFDLSLILLGSNEEEDSSISDIDELILRASLLNTKSDTIVHLYNLQEFNALTIQSSTAQFNSAFKKLLNVFYNQSYDSLLIDSVRIGRLNSLHKLSDEDLQRYHADKFVTSRLLFVIEGNFSYETVQNAVERSFYDKTIGEFDPNSLKYPENPFNLNVRSTELNTESTGQMRYFRE